MDKPLRLKKPKGPKNWYRNGRWHKVYPRPGRTQFRRGDLCQFRPDLLDVEVIDVCPTADKDVFFYTVRCLNSGHSFSTYGSDLLLLQRVKPQLEVRVKPKLVFNPKPVPPPKPKLRIKFRKVEPHFVKPEKDVIARLSCMVMWGGHSDEPHWVYMDFKDEKALEEEFWKRVEEKPNVHRRLRKFGNDPRYWSAVTDRRGKEHWVCIEWFSPEYKYQPKGKANGRPVESVGSVLPRKKAVLRSGPGSKRKAVSGRNPKARTSKPTVLPSGKPQPNGSGKSGKTRTSDQRRKK